MARKMISLISTNISKMSAVVLAGGEGIRLFPLTRERAKPAVPFGGRFRLVDFALSNLINSGIVRIKVLTQFKSDSLIQHITRGWTLAHQLGQYIDIVPAQMRLGPYWYSGNADAVHQSLGLISDEKPQYVCVLGADHVYRMDLNQMLEFHISKGADVTISAVPYPKKASSAFGIIAADGKGKVVRFLEKPSEPPSIPGRKDYSFVSMGIYIFTFSVLKELLDENASIREGSHDFGRDILPCALSGEKVFAYDFSTNRVPGIAPAEGSYWRDIGSIDSYYKASMELIKVTPVFNLYNYEWPIFSHYEPHPPAKFVFADPGRTGTAIDSMISEGCLISGSKVERSILFPQVRAHSYSHIEDSIIFEGVTIGRHSRIRRAIIDKEAEIAPNVEIGYDLESDKKRFYVSPGGIVVIPRCCRVAALGKVKG